MGIYSEFEVVDKVWERIVKQVAVSDAVAVAVASVVVVVTLEREVELAGAESGAHKAQEQQNGAVANCVEGLPLEE